MAVTAGGIWIPDLVPKGYEVFNDYHRFLLVDGPRYAGKSFSIDHKAVRHAFENDGAVVGVVVKYLGKGVQGVWNDLQKKILPQWFRAGITEYTVEPTMLNDSKMRYFRIRNYYGGESEFQLHSCQHEHLAEEQFKDTSFSMLYMVEADKHNSRLVFDTLAAQLRSITVPATQLQLVCDTNPPVDGTRHWLWRTFVEKAGLTDEDALMRDQFHRIRFRLDDNTMADPVQVASLKASCRHDKVRYARYVDGEWVLDTAGSIFEDVFMPNIHVVGDTGSPNREEWDYIVPGPELREFVTGWDLGDFHHYACILVKRETGRLPAFDLLDEVESGQRKMSLGDFVARFLEKMDFWEQFMRKEHGATQLRWRHWSDTSAMRWRSIVDANEAILVDNLSDGRIHLLPIQKGKIEQRVQFFRNLIGDNRFFVSAMCPAAIKMLQGLRRGPTISEYIDREDPLKHALDGITYALCEESPRDIALRNQPLAASTFSVAV